MSRTFETASGRKYARKLENDFSEINVACHWVHKQADRIAEEAERILARTKQVLNRKPDTNLGS